MIVTLASPPLWPRPVVRPPPLGELLAALSAMSADELAAVEGALAAHAAARRVDFVQRLPPELAVAVARRLAPHDAWPCLHVSVRWRRFFLQPEVVADLCPVLYPGLLECAARRAGGDRAHGQGPAVLASQLREFKAACLHSFARHRGRFVAVSLQRPWLAAALPGGVAGDPNLAPADLLACEGQLGACPGEPWPLALVGTALMVNALYSSGRLAWEPASPEHAGADGWYAVVDELRSRRRRILQVPRLYGNLATRLSLFCIGDGLLVARDTSQRRLVAWDLAGEEEPAFRRTILPERVCKAATAGQVVIGTYYESRDAANLGGGGDGDDDHVKIWRWTCYGRGRNVEWTLSRPAKLAAQLREAWRRGGGRCHSLLIHPLAPGIVYLCIGSLDDEKPASVQDPVLATMTVFEVTEGTLSGSWTVGLPSGWAASSDPSEYKFEPISKYGSYNVASISRDGPRRGTRCHDHLDFNIYTKVFTFTTTCVPFGAVLSSQRMRWNDECISWQQPLQDPPQEPREMLPLVITPTWPHQTQLVEASTSLSRVPMLGHHHHACCIDCAPRTNPAALSPIESHTHTSLHDALVEKASRLDLAREQPPSAEEWSCIRTTDTQLAAAYAALDACRPVATLDYDAGFHGHVRPPRAPAEGPTLPLLRGDDEFLIFVSWAGYTAWRYHEGGDYKLVE